MKEISRTLILGGSGLVGNAIKHELLTKGYHLNETLFVPDRHELDLFQQTEVNNYIKKIAPSYIIMSAAKVGGIHANDTYRGDFILENLMIQCNVFKAALDNSVPKLLFMGSSCIYPRDCLQPMKEEYLLTSPLEKTNEPYAIAKIAGLKTAENLRRQYGLEYVSVMPTNLYGENDNFHPENSHVIPGLIAKLFKAKNENREEFSVWGSGRPRREFLYVNDLANAVVFLMEKGLDSSLPDIINIGTGIDISIKELSQKIAEKIGYKGKLIQDCSRKDGTMQKLLDISLIKSLGWSPRTSLDEGLERVILHYRKNCGGK